MSFVIEEIQRLIAHAQSPEEKATWQKLLDFLVGENQDR